MLRKKSFPLALIAIIILAFVLRVIAVSPGYPAIHPDEPVIYHAAFEMIKDGKINPGRFDYPMLSMWINAFAYQVFFLPLTLTKTFLLNIVEYVGNLSNFKTFIVSFALSGPNKPIRFWGRYVSVIFGTASVLMIYFLGKESFGKNAGLLSAFLLAVNYLHLVDSIFILPGVYNIFFHLLAFWFFFVFLRSPSRKKYLLSGVFLGLVVATKMQTMIFLPFGLTHLFIALKETKTKAFFKKLFAFDFFLAILTAVVTFFIINPFMLLEHQEAWRWITWNARRYGFGVIKLRVTPLWYFYEIALTRPVFWLSALGICLGLFKKRYRQATILFLSFILFTFFILLVYTHGGIYGRNWALLTPFFILFLSLFLVEVFKKRLVWLFLVATLVSFSSIKNCLLTSWFLAKDWNSVCVDNWVVVNMPFRAKVGIAAPVPMKGLSQKNVDWLNYEMATNFTLPEVQREKIEYLLVNVNALRGGLNNWIGADNMFWEMPSDVFNNSLEGLVIKQLSRHAVISCLKPWPVPEYSYFVVRVPPESNKKDSKLIKHFSFKENGLAWQAQSVRPTEIEGFFWQSGKECFQDNCLKIAQGSGSNFKPVRFISEAIPVKPGKKYLVSGLVRAEKELEGQTPAGFLRIDFYQEEELNGGERGIIAAVSDRVSGGLDWQEKQVEETAPEGARFLRVSLQHQSPLSGFFYDEIEVYELDSSQEEIEAANQVEIGDHHVYPEII